MWTCPKCATKVDPSFDVCWNCGTSVDGVEDPTFVKADDAGPLAGDPLVPELDTGEDVAVEGDLPEPIRGDLVEAYSALDLMEATFLADQLNQAGIQAVHDTHDLHDTLGTMEGGPKVWVRADDLPRARAWLETYDRDKVAPTGD
jgi:Putative prokaryotic signal transducing protein